MKKYMRGVMLAIVMLAPPALLAGCEDKVSQASFDQIQIGMTLGEVEHIMGGKGSRQEVTGVSISGAGVAGGGPTSSEDIYVWSKGRKEISVKIKDNKVTDRSSSGI